MKKLSIITALYASGPYIKDFCKGMEDAISQIDEIGDQFEIILVNDCSPDDSLEIAREICSRNCRIRIIDLSRNFGQHKALLTGLRYAQGDFIFMIDSDLEEDPAYLKTFWKELHKEKSLDFVCGVQVTRKGDWLERYSGSCFFNFFNFFAESKIVPNQLTARLMTRRYADALLQFRESEVLLVSICNLAGYNQKFIPLNKKNKGSSGYNFFKRLKTAIDLITSFSSRPAEFVFYLGLLIFIVSIAMMCYAFYPMLTLGHALHGWTSLASSLWFLGGLIILCQGIIGLYIARIYEQVKNRPFSIVKWDSALENTDFTPPSPPGYRNLTVACASTLSQKEINVQSSTVNIANSSSSQNHNSMITKHSLAACECT
ncbi:MAG: glycosyltransferase family 2 protein [Candidatus Obscuribacterales bacterium]|nr:glycosyltransferase family 2 protein [Candidatus Obscuribacterales bacterium]